ncbi:MAG: AEC family transporter [Muribaculaceae bacterium]|nr:AEC family transporter [Roseburia sp.]MCM1431495.1 AEC family transporter [Muribaculaceae bacterium]MCM1493211.1 AEC family transporter [Muribaculaceae bacterium]
MSDILVLQITMFLLILVGAVIKKLKIVSPEGQKNINDLVIYLVLPCNIVCSFLIECDGNIFRQFGLVFVISVAVQAAAVLLGRLLYGRKEQGHRMSLQYGVICSNAGFLGNPVAEGVFGAIGLAMASVYLIPMRVMMWSSGIAIYTHSTDVRKTLKKVVTHPCILACGLGLLLMVGGWRPPEVILKPLSTIGGCNTALSMMVIGMILADADVRTLFDREILAYSFLRLVGMPAVLYALCRLCRVPALVTGVCTLLTAMPAGATTSILASKYQADELFATRLVVASTMLSMITIPVWSHILT